MSIIVQRRVEGHVGEINDPPLLNHLLERSAREVVQDLPLRSLEPLYVELTDSGTGVSTINHLVVSVHKGGVRALPFDYAGLARTTFVSTEPGYYTFAGKTYVKPGGGTILAVAYPSVTAESSDVAGVPFEMVNLIVTWTAALWLDHEMSKIGADASVNAVMPTAPTAPAAPTISYVNAVAVAPAAVSIGALPTAPTYQSQSVTLASAPTVPDVDLTVRVDGLTALTPPTAPAAPVIAYTDAVAASISQTTISALPAPPSFTKPVFGGSLTLPTIPVLDATKKVDGVTSLVIPAAPSAPSLTSAGITDVSIDALPTPPAYTKVAATIDRTDLDSMFTELDPEMMAQTISEVGTQISETQIKVQEEVNEFNKEVEAYRASVQRSVEQARLTLEERRAEMDSTDRLALEGYAQSLARHDRLVSTYAADIGAVVQKWQSDFQRIFQAWAQEQALHMDEFRAQIDAEASAFSGAMQDHIKEADRVLAQAQLDQQRLARAAELATETSVQNEARTLEAAVADYSQELARYRDQLAVFSADASLVLQKYSAQLDPKVRVFEVERRTSVEHLAAKVSDARSALEADVTSYNASVQKIIEQARVTAQEAAQTAENATTVALQNKARTLEAAISDYAQELTLFQVKVALHGNEVEAALGQINAENIARQRKLRMLQSDRATITRMYQEQRARYMRSFKSRRPLSPIPHDF